MKKISFIVIWLLLFLLVSISSYSQTRFYMPHGENLTLGNSEGDRLGAGLSKLNYRNRPLAYRSNPTSVNIPLGYTSDEYKPWDSEKHFWIGAGEIAILEFIPWALAKWIRHWEDPADNWANVSSETWWNNISKGWEYDGDNFETNNFAHPYHGALFFNAGRTNGYNFWESSLWALTGSAIWEYFGETFRPAFNDWVYTGIGGSNLGEILYRLSSMVTDNRASGSERVWSEIFGTLINPVRGFNRAISGEMGRNFPNPEWSRPKDFMISFDGGIRRLDKSGNALAREGVEEGLFSFDLVYGNPFKAKEPFSFFQINMALATGLPHFTTLNTRGHLFGTDSKKSGDNLHRFAVSLDFIYNNVYKGEEDSAKGFEGILFGNASVYPHVMSSFAIGKQISINTQLGINGILMGATPNDYYFDVEGRNYDFGPGIGTRLVASLRKGHWDYLSILYYGTWIWTQSEPSNSKHHIHFIWGNVQLPLTDYFAFGFGAGLYWRNSYYEDFDNINRDHPVLRIFFKTLIF